VDLNLDEFNLSAPTELARHAVCISLEAGVDISSAFWSNLDSTVPSSFNEADKSLLRKVFNPRLCDRREEGVCFVPPDTSFAYVQKLRHLVKEEETLHQKRKDHFFSRAFSLESPGPLFPPSWTAAVQIARPEASGKRGCQLHACPNYKAQAHIWEKALKSDLPVFDKSTEDGTRFRVYKLGSGDVRTTEVRTTREHDGREIVGAVFSSQPWNDTSRQDKGIRDDERIVKATEYVQSKRSGKGYDCYVVLETDKGNDIVTKDLIDGTFTRDENPGDLEERTSLAKVVRTDRCSIGNVTVGDLANCQSAVYSWVTKYFNVASSTR